ncbi:MAG: hypothetical protein SGI77_06220 [Pirellulaceae bacterium]|nr:hypothetical protein [Pirellulaceae bacterium]
MRKRSGYVLLMVLILLVVLTTALTSIATRSMNATQDAVIAVTQLQQRVGIESCRNTFLEKAFFVFKEIDKRRSNGFEPPSTDGIYIWMDSIVLGGQRFDLILSDENSKVNLNATYFHTGPDKTDQLLRRGLPVRFRQAIALQPSAAANRSNALPPKKTRKPDDISADDSIDPENEGIVAIGEAFDGPEDDVMIPAFRSWGEVFNFGALFGQNSERTLPLDFTKTFTLWGSGQINALRAPDASILIQLEALVPAAGAKSILKSIRQSRDFDLRAIIDEEVAGARQRQRLRALLGKDSYAFSLFVNVEAPQTRSRRLFTISPDTNGTQEVQEFVFY